MNFNTILFDLDDTLLDRNMSLSVFIELFISKYAHLLVHEDISKFKDTFIDLDCRGYKPREEMFRELIDRTSWIRQPDIKDIMNYWYAEFPQCATPMTDLYKVLDYIKDKKISMGIVTNSITNFQYRKIDQLDLRKYMSSIIISEEVGISKPDPEIYCIALSRIGAKPETTLFVGDSPSIDIKGAYDSKIKSAWISNGKAWGIHDYKPDYIIEDLSGLIDLVV